LVLSGGELIEINQKKLMKKENTIHCKYCGKKLTGLQLAALSFGIDDNCTQCLHDLTNSKDSIETRGN